MPLNLILDRSISLKRVTGLNKMGLHQRKSLVSVRNLVLFLLVHFCISLLITIRLKDGIPSKVIRSSWRNYFSLQ